MNKAFKRTKKFVSAEERYWKRLGKQLRGRSTSKFTKLEKGNKIVWLPISPDKFSFMQEEKWEAAYRKTDKYKCKPLMYRIAD